jgi:hypothetical protein
MALWHCTGMFMYRHTRRMYMYIFLLEVKHLNEQFFFYKIIMSLHYAIKVGFCNHAIWPI